MAKMHHSFNFLRKVLDGMQDWVRVISRAGAVVYTNRAMSRAVANSEDARAFFDSLGGAPAPLMTPPLDRAEETPPKYFIYDGGKIADSGWREHADFVRSAEDVVPDSDSVKNFSGFYEADEWPFSGIAENGDADGAPSGSAQESISLRGASDESSPGAEKTTGKSVESGAEKDAAYLEIRIGNKTYAVSSSPLYGILGSVDYTVEVFRDITHLKDMQNKIVEQNQKFEYDLDMAKMLQRRLLPSKSPNPRVGFQYIYRPCDMLGGDFVDIYNIGEDHLGIYIADVSGHGVSASVLTVFLRSSISKRLTSPAEALKQLYNDFNKTNFEPDVYITVFYAIYDLKKNVLTYSNAGHNAIPFLYNKHNPTNMRRLRTPGLPISNWSLNTEYDEITVDVAPGDLLFMHTDGLTEMKDSKREMFGHNRLEKTLMSGDSNDTARLLFGVLKTAFQFAGIDNKSMLSDDVTMSVTELISAN